MVKQTVNYTDYNGEATEEVLYFNLNKAELMNMSIRENEGLSAYLNDLYTVDKDGKKKVDPKKIVECIDQFIIAAYGEKSEDGKYFLKKDANGNRLVDKFMQSEAYSALFMDLVTDPEKATTFLTGLMPSDMAAELSKQIATTSDANK